ncbi:MAG: MFS transporter [Chloroflexota bacterium]|nr:MFS transporter [Dehalococcoidia bacterium]MDW8252579.1 MFS transporter [Chloroflexota bacterium]
MEAEHAAAARRWPRMFSSLELPVFRFYLTGMLFSSLPMTMLMMVQGYLAYRLTGYAAALGLIALAWGLPQLALVMVGGVVADRYERRRILIVTQSVAMGMTLIMAVLIFSGVLQLWMMALVALLHGTAFAFNMPARQGMAPDLVDDERLTNAVAVNNASFSLTRIAGPALAGALIATPSVGVGGVYLLMSACYLTAVLFLLRLPAVPPRRPAQQRSVAGDIREAIAHIWHTPVLRVLIVLGALLPLLGMPFQMLLPVFAVTVLDVGAAGLGVMNTMMGLGALAGSLLVAWRSDHPHKGRLQAAAAIGFGIAITAFAVIHHFLLGLAILFAAGILSQTFLALNSTLVMLHADRALLGRVMGLLMMTMALTPLTTVPISAAADAIGVVPTSAALGILLAGGVALTLALNPGYAAAAGQRPAQAPMGR